MVCKKCGQLLKDGAMVCEYCGTEISYYRNNAGLQGRRQGKQAPQPQQKQNLPQIDPDSRKAQEMPQEEEKQAQPVHTYKVRKVMINWVAVAIAIAALFLVALVAGFVFLKVTDPGQLILARMGKEANATAMWAYGQELLDQGYIDRSIEAFNKAYEQEPDREDIYAHLQQLADAYEAGGYIGKAEETYRLMTTVNKEKTSAWRSVVRIMQDQDRKMELATYLTEAYENTKDSSFRRQREALLPSTPTTDLEAGTRMYARDVAILSKEDYEIYYILGEEGILPEDGTLYEGPIHLEEGVHVLRAVAVSNDLISDEMMLKYNITLPVPSAPYPSLAPGTYEQRQRVRLKYLKTEDEEMQLDYLKNDPVARAEAEQKQNDITMYYTLDGQTPTSNSPIYEGDGILMPGGYVILKAVSVNGYGKVSNVLERKYKINNVPFKKFFNNTDEMADVTIMKTTRDQFIKKFGQPNEEVETEDATVRGVTLKMTYNWGEAKFVMISTGYVLYSLDTGNSAMVGPRKTKIGQKEEEVTAMFRDMGQAHDQNGDRSLYWNDQNNGNDKGKLFHLDDTHDRIDYSYVREDGGTVTMSYYLENGVVQRMSIRYRLL